MREAASIIVLKELLSAGASVCAHDPVAMHEAQLAMGIMPGLTFGNTMIQAAQNADALIIVTEWKAFRAPDFDMLRLTLKTPVIFDGRNLYDPKQVRDAGFEYFPIGRI
jgi:UDPglucose 6-dehydrogenase